MAEFWSTCRCHRSRSPQYDSCLSGHLAEDRQPWKRLGKPILFQPSMILQRHLEPWETTAL